MRSFLSNQSYGEISKEEELCCYEPALMLLKPGWTWGSTDDSKLCQDISKSLHLPVHTHNSHDGTAGKLVAGIQGCNDGAEKPPKNPLSSPCPLVNKKRHSDDVDQISYSQVADINVRNSFIPRPERNGEEPKAVIECMHLLQFMPPVTTFQLPNGF